MAFSYKTKKKGTEIVPLIDMVFLLLIFFLVTTETFQVSESKEQVPVNSRNLPESPGSPVSSNETLKNLLIRVEDDSSAVEDRRLVYFVEPENGNFTFKQALQKAGEDADFVIVYNDTLMCNRNNFLASHFSREIQEKIHTYREILRDKPVNDRIIDICADKDTPFRLIYYLMEQCSNGDSLTVVKKVNIITFGKII